MWWSGSSTLGWRDEGGTWSHQGMVRSAWWKDVWWLLWRTWCGSLRTPVCKEWLASSCCFHWGGRGADNEM